MSFKPFINVVFSSVLKSHYILWGVLQHSVLHFMFISRLAIALGNLHSKMWGEFHV